LIRTVTITALGWAALGCVAAQGPPAAPPAPDDGRTVDRVPHLASAFDPGAGRLGVSVRMASEADLAALEPPEGQVREVLEISGAILLSSGVLAAHGCPACLSNAVLAAGYALVAAPVAAAVDAAEHAEARRVEQALVARDLPARTRAALARLRPDAAPGIEDAELLVLGYGFAEAGERGACFFLDAHLVAGGREQVVLLGPWRRSDDAPPPHCASRRELASRGGDLTTRIADESAEILAGLVASRLAEAP
jgi:hypothetical protein